MSETTGSNTTTHAHRAPPERTSGEKGLFRYAPEPLPPRNTPKPNTKPLAYFYSAQLAWFYSALDTLLTDAGDCKLTGIVDHCPGGVGLRVNAVGT